MSRKIWMDKTIEAARTADIRMPWSRSAKADDVQAQPVKLQAKG